MNFGWWMVVDIVVFQWVIMLISGWARCRKGGGMVNFGAGMLNFSVRMLNFRAPRLNFSAPRLNPKAPMVNFSASMVNFKAPRLNFSVPRFGPRAGRLSFSAARLNFSGLRFGARVAAGNYRGARCPADGLGRGRPSHLLRGLGYSRSGRETHHSHAFHSSHFRTPASHGTGRRKSDGVFWGDGAGWRPR